MAAQTQARSETRRRLIEGSMLSAGVLVAVALFVMVNYLSARHYQRLDWTSADLYSLSEKSENIIADLDRDIDAIVFLSPGSVAYDQVDELLSRYEAASNGRIEKRIIDPVRDRLGAQALIERYAIERENVLVLASGDDKRVIDEYELVELDYAGAQYGQQPSVKAFRGEQLITSAILELVEARKPMARFVTGHGEATPGGAGGGRMMSAAGELLGKDNFDFETFASLGAEAVPEGTDLLVIASPSARFLESELAIFDAYLAAGGRMLLLLDPAFDPTGGFLDLGLGAWLAARGVSIREDVVIDPVRRLPIYGPETIFTDSYGAHPIVEPLAGRSVLMPLARSVTRAATVPDGVEVDELVRTSAEAWGETDLSDLETIGAGDEDLSGPLALGVAASWPVSSPDEAEPSPEGDDVAEEAEPEKEARLVVFGDFDFASDDMVINGANAALLLNALNWLTEREQLLAIEPRSPEQTKLLLSAGELSSIYWLILVLMPGAAIVAGIVVYLKRRR